MLLLLTGGVSYTIYSIRRLHQRLDAREQIQAILRDGPPDDGGPTPGRRLYLVPNPVREHPVAASTVALTAIGIAAALVASAPWSPTPAPQRQHPPVA
ncbi:hypothetical protein, partial [Amycolatopsis deserti]|uniref:hypothetical protein n=1 Tax=Amycolatopsis deserti TaxID=185696 RepID=UPI00174C6740